MPLVWIGLGILAFTAARGAKKKTLRQKLEEAFGLALLTVQQCGPVQVNGVDLFDDLGEFAEIVGRGKIDVLRTELGKVCPAVLDATPEQISAMGKLGVQTIETALGILSVSFERCPNEVDRLQTQTNFTQFFRDLATVGPLGAVSAFRERMRIVCPGIEAVSGEDIQKRGRRRFDELAKAELSRFAA